MPARAVKSGLLAGASGVVLTARLPLKLGGGFWAAPAFDFDFAWEHPSSVARNGGGAATPRRRRHLFPAQRANCAFPPLLTCPRLRLGAFFRAWPRYFVSSNTKGQRRDGG